jgi:hypothetical protein
MPQPSRLTFVEDAGRDKFNRSIGIFKCQCGNLTTVTKTAAKTSRTKSCGCLRHEKECKHGASKRSGHDPEYNVWARMISRCTKPANLDYKNYGARGIRVCDEWLSSYAAFIADMGSRPSEKHTIERLDNDRGYAPDNCEWATRKVQANNRRPRTVRLICGKGHAMDGDNVYARPDGKRGCKECRKINMRNYYAREATAK